MTRTMLSSLLITAALYLVPEAAAYHSSLPPPFTSASISWTPPYVADGPRWRPIPLYVEHDGERYTHIVARSDQVETNFRLQASVEAGYRIFGVVVVAGDAQFHIGNDEEPYFPPVDRIGVQEGVDEQTIDLRRTFKLPAVDAVASAFPPELTMNPFTGVRIRQVSPDRQLVRLCSDRFTSGLPTKNQALIPINILVHVAFSAGKEKAIRSATWDVWRPHHASGRPAVAHTVFPAQVICRGK